MYQINILFDVAHTNVQAEALTYVRYKIQLFGHLILALDEHPTLRDLNVSYR